MGHRNRNRQRHVAVAAAIGLAVALATMAGGTSAFAQSASEDEEVPLDTKLMRQFLKDLGLRRDGEGIDYRERAPLVVPPSRNLPPPQSEASVTSNPAWPKDPDVQQRKVEATRKKQAGRTAAETMEAEGRPISRSELDRGKIAAGTSANAGSPQNPDDSARAMRPSELGSKSFFSDIFSTFSDKGETGTFTGEPTRESLTAPPAGYQTPSPAQPYGLAPKHAKGKAATVEDRAVGAR
ncbi:MAG TPA: hypothetical protein VE200_04765 [Xanthobacteraceae bacterium]|nr:hypothetical protein [Xanthobacteraceae bacterium]